MEFSLVVLIVGARPNFVKMAPVARALGKAGVPFQICNVGQHYDWAMSGSFFPALQIPEPAINLEVGSGSHGVQTAKAMERLESYFQTLVQKEGRPLVVVFGDVNSTLAAAITAAKMHLPVAHVEAGLRSRDRTMPEEINRIVTDHCANIHFCTEESGVTHLKSEGITQRVHLVGNTMIDSLFWWKDQPSNQNHLASIPQRFGVERLKFGMVTLHRPRLVDDVDLLDRWMAQLDEISRQLPLVFPIHPRTRTRLKRAPQFVKLIEPLEYADFTALMMNSTCMITDSGGVQEEASALGIPTYTARENTERPVTITHGTSRLVGVDPAAFRQTWQKDLEGGFKVQPPNIPLWDGKAAERIVAILRGF